MLNFFKAPAKSKNFRQGGNFYYVRVIFKIPFQNCFISPVFYFNSYFSRPLNFHAYSSDSRSLISLILLMYLSSPENPVSRNTLTIPLASSSGVWSEAKAKTLMSSSCRAASICFLLIAKPDRRSEEHTSELQ